MAPLGRHCGATGARVSVAHLQSCAWIRCPHRSWHKAWPAHSSHHCGASSAPTDAPLGGSRPQLNCLGSCTHPPRGNPDRAPGSCYTSWLLTSLWLSLAAVNIWESDPVHGRSFSLSLNSSHKRQPVPGSSTVLSPSARNSPSQHSQTFIITTASSVQ